MAYIRKMKNKEGKIYVYLVEGYRENGKVKSRILEKYGYLDELEAQEPGIFEKLKKEAKEGKLVDKKILDIFLWIVLFMRQINFMVGKS